MKIFATVFKVNFKVKFYKNFKTKITAIENYFNIQQINSFFFVFFYIKDALNLL